MSSANDGGPAFPQPMIPSQKGDGTYTNPSDGWGLGGMSLREYFAGRAVQAFIQSDPPDATTPMGKYAKEIAASAVIVADAAIAKLREPDQVRESAVEMLDVLKAVLIDCESRDIVRLPSAMDAAKRLMKAAIAQAEAAGLKI